MTVAAPKLKESPREQFQGLVLEGVSWDYYMRTVDELIDTHQNVRITYDSGRMEFMPPISDEHEDAKKVIARLLELYSLQRKIPMAGRGSVTMLHPKLEKGAEADECY